MPTYTYVGNTDPRNKVRTILLRKGTLELNVGTYASLTPLEIAEIYASGQFILQAGIVAGAVIALQDGLPLAQSTVMYEWEPFTAYEREQLVTHEGSIYTYKLKLGQELEEKTFNEANWELAAAKGSGKGEKGEKGETGATGPAGEAGLNWRGEWKGSTAYKVHDAVFRKGSSYVCILEMSSGTDVEPPEATHWSLLAEKGERGEIGITWRNEWKATTAYGIDDAVFWKGSSYICKVAMTSGEDKEPPEATHWSLLAEKGEKGEKGEAGGGGGGGLVWRNEWKPATAYAINDAVSYKGSSYVCKKAMTIGEDVAPPEATHWEVLAEKGEAGEGSGSNTPEGIGAPAEVTNSTKYWTPKTVYKEKEIVLFSGTVYKAKENHTSLEKWEETSTKWSVVGVAVQREYVWLQDPAIGAQPGVNLQYGDQSKKIKIALERAKQVVAGTQGIVSGERGTYELGEPSNKANFGRELYDYTNSKYTLPFSNMFAYISIPKNVGIFGHGPNELIFRSAFGCSGLGTEEIEKGGERGCVVAYEEGGGRASKTLSDVEIAALGLVNTTGTHEEQSKQVPKLIDGICAHGAGETFKTKITGNFRGAVVSHLDHHTFYRCEFNAWAKIIFPGSKPAGGNIYFLDCGMVGGFCAIYVEPGGGMGGVTVVGGHSGFSSGPVIYKKSVNNIGENLASGVTFERHTVEEPARGIIVDDSMSSVVKGVKFINCLVASGGIGPIGGYKRGDISQPRDAVVKALGVNELIVEGFLFTNSGFDPGTGCLIRANSIQKCDLGDITTGLRACKSLGMPVFRCEQQEGNIAHYYEEATKLDVRFRTVVGPARISRGDVIEKVAATKGTAKTVHQMNANRFEMIGAQPEGIALLGATPSAGQVSILPYAVKSNFGGLVKTRLAHLGTGYYRGNTPSVNITGANQVIEVGTGHSITASTRGFPPTGELVVNNVPLTYGSITESKFSEVTNNSGSPVTITTKTAIKLVIWPPNKRGAETKTTAPLLLGEGAPPPITIDISSLYKESLRKVQLTSLGDFSEAGQVISYHGTGIFTYKKGIPTAQSTIEMSSSSPVKYMQVKSVSSYPNITGGSTGYENAELELTGNKLNEEYSKTPHIFLFFKWRKAKGEPWVEYKSKEIKVWRGEGLVVEKESGAEVLRKLGTTATELQEALQGAEGPSGQKLPAASIKVTGGPLATEYERAGKLKTQTASMLIFFQGEMKGLVRDLESEKFFLGSGGAVAIWNKPLIGNLRVGSNTIGYAGVNTNAPETKVSVEAKKGAITLVVESVGEWAEQGNSKPGTLIIAGKYYGYGKIEGTTKFTSFGPLAQEVGASLVGSITKLSTVVGSSIKVTNVNWAYWPKSGSLSLASGTIKYGKINEAENKFEELTTAVEVHALTKNTFVTPGSGEYEVKATETAGFALSGAITIAGHKITYKRKNSTEFLGCEGSYGVTVVEKTKITGESFFGEGTTILYNGQIVEPIVVGTKVEGFPELTDLTGQQKLHVGELAILEGIPAEMLRLGGGGPRKGSVEEEFVGRPHLNNGAPSKTAILRAIEVESVVGFNETGGLIKIYYGAGPTEFVWALYKTFLEAEPRTRFLGPEFKLKTAIETATHGVPTVLGAANNSQFPASGTLCYEAIKPKNPNSVIEVSYTEKLTVETETTATEINFEIEKSFEVKDASKLPSSGWLTVGEKTEVKYAKITANKIEGCSVEVIPGEIPSLVFPKGTSVICDTFQGCKWVKGGTEYIVAPKQAHPLFSTSPIRKYIVGVSYEGGHGAEFPIGTKIVDAEVLAAEGSSGYPIAPASLVIADISQVPYEKFLSIAGGELEAEEEEATEEESGSVAEGSEEFEIEEGVQTPETQTLAYFAIVNPSFISKTEPASNSGSAIVGGTLLEEEIKNFSTVEVIKVKSVENFPSSGILQVGTAIIRYDEIEVTKNEFLKLSEPSEVSTNPSESVTTPASGEYTLKVNETLGFPASGEVSMEGAKVKYTKKTLTQFEGCTGGYSLTINKETIITGIGNFLVGQPVTLSIGNQVAEGSVLTARYDKQHHEQGDKGLAAIKGAEDEALATTAAPDEGGTVWVEI